jgi:general nucleoside transport system ATP-binding protein
LESLLEMRGITKTFPGVVANDKINITFRRGEVHCLLGENGAGKTTLMNILFGLYQPDDGEIILNGKPVAITDPATAINYGIGMVHQHFMLVNPLTVAENIVLGNEPPSRFIFPMKEAVEDVTRLSQLYGLVVNPKTIIEDLPLGIRQRVEIIKALYRKADILILDEPTAVLSPPEIKELYKVIKSLRESGKTIIFITHKLKETMAISDRVTVLRDGRVVGTVNLDDTSPEKLAKMMVGREVILRIQRKFQKAGNLTLSIHDLVVDDNRGQPVVNDISINVYEGEIYGIAGIEGNGQTELVEAIMGLRPIRSGNVYLNDVSIKSKTPSQILAAGLGHVPEDRLNRGLIAQFTLAENFILGYHRNNSFNRYGILQEKRIESHAKELVAKYNIRTPSIHTLGGSLSGGNQQKTVLARVFSSNPKALIVSQPTRGVDVGATEYVHKQLLNMRQEGVAILLVSADLDEIRSLSDRIGVIYQGEIKAEKSSDEFSEEELGLCMAGESI